MKQQQFNEAQEKTREGIGNTKNAAGRAILDRRAAEINRVIGHGEGITEGEIWSGKDEVAKEQLRTINRRFAPELQAIQDTYASGGRAHGVPVEDLVVTPDTLEFKPRGTAKSSVSAPTVRPPQTPGRGGPTTTAPGAQATHTEADVRAAAIARGKNADAAVNLARQRGLIK